MFLIQAWFPTFWALKTLFSYKLKFCGNMIEIVHRCPFPINMFSLSNLHWKISQLIIIITIIIIMISDNLMFYNWGGSFMNCGYVDRNNNKCWLCSDRLKMAGETVLPRVSSHWLSAHFFVPLPSTFLFPSKSVLKLGWSPLSAL